MKFITNYLNTDFNLTRPIRDKIAASKAKGMWQGGRAPFGYDIGDRRLVANANDVPELNRIFELYLELNSVNELEIELKKLKIKSRVRFSKRGGEYGGAYFSRGAIYNLLQNPVYIGKISHKGEIHEGLHDAIISKELWDAVQKKIKEQAKCPKGLLGTKHRNLLTSRLFDESGDKYSPVYTNHKNKQRYRYYLNKELALDKKHPRYSRARFPAHEIEKIVEKELRKKLPSFVLEPEGADFEYLMKHQNIIPTYNLVRALVEKVVVHHDELILHVRPSELEKIAQEYLSIVLICDSAEVFINVPYRSEKAQDGAILIQSESKDIFDLPPKILKKLIQGVLWRDEHFNGLTIKAIARRERCSHDYVSSAIFKSFEILQNAA